MVIARAGLDRLVLAGEVAVVTGAGRGIGRETALALAHLGATVVIAEVRETGRETEELIRRDGGEGLYVACDVSSPDDMARLGDHVQERYGCANILVNNAISLTVKPLLEHSVEEWDRVMAVNLRGAFLGIKTFLPGMLAAGHGTIVTMESADGMPFIAPYLASKAGLRSLALSLANELGDGSAVAAYCFGPGIVETPGLMAAFRELAPRYGQHVDAFVSQSGLPLIPADLSAAGLVGTILHANAFHGQETSYVAGLAKLGLGPTGEPRDAAEGRAEAPPEVGNDEQQAVALHRRLEDHLRAYVREFREMNVLMRPVAKRMFRQDTGRSAEDWLALAEARTRELQHGIDGARRAAYATELRALITHIAKQEAMVPAWIRDPQALDLALTGLRERRETVEALVAVMEGPE